MLFPFKLMTPTIDSSGFDQQDDGDELEIGFFEDDHKAADE